MSLNVMIWPVVLGVVVLIAVVGLLWWASRRAQGRATPGPSSTAAATVSEPDAWSQAITEAGQARPDAVDQPRTFFSRDSLLAPDRELDPSRWDNRPDGSEEHEEGEAPRGSGAIDAGFIQSLRERGKDA